MQLSEAQQAAIADEVTTQNRELFASFTRLHDGAELSALDEGQIIGAMKAGGILMAAQTGMATAKVLKTSAGS